MTNKSFMLLLSVPICTTAFTCKIGSCSEWGIFTSSLKGFSFLHTLGNLAKSINFTENTFWTWYISIHNNKYSAHFWTQHFGWFHFYFYSLFFCFLYRNFCHDLIHPFFFKHVVFYVVYTLRSPYLSQIFDQNQTIQ